MNVKSFFFLFLILLFGCEDSSVNSTKELINTSWQLGLFEVDGSFIVPPNNQIYRIKFEEQNSFSGINDCNDIFGHYEVESNFIKLDSIFTTEVGCGELSMGDRFYKALIGSYSYRIDQNKLTINYDTNSKLVFSSEYREWNKNETVYV